jgi:hypothetical protein
VFSGRLGRTLSTRLALSLRVHQPERTQQPFGYTRVRRGDGQQLELVRRERHGDTALAGVQQNAAADAWSAVAHTHLDGLPRIRSRMASTRDQQPGQSTPNVWCGGSAVAAQAWQVTSARS